MLPVEEFVALYDLEEPLPGLTLPKPDTAHDLMLARLQFELAERQRYILRRDIFEAKGQS